MLVAEPPHNQNWNIRSTGQENPTALALRNEGRMAIDPNFYYRLSNAFLGPGYALDVKADGSGRLKMAIAADQSGQFWCLIDLGGGKLALRTLYLGDCFSLDVINVVSSHFAASPLWKMKYPSPFSN